MQASYIFFSLSAVISAFISTLFGFFIYFRNKQSKMNKTFALFCFGVTIWSIPYIFWPLATTAKETLLAFQLLHIGACYVSIFYFHFTVRWLEIFEKKKKIIYVGYILATLFALSIPTPFFIKDIVPKFSMRYWAEPGILYHFFLVMFFGYFLYSSYLLFKAYRESTGVRKFQIKYILVGMVLAFLGGSTNYFLWYNINIPPYGNIFSCSFVIFTAYAIIKYRFMDIRIIARSSAIYFLDALYTYAVFSLLLIIYNLFWGTVYNNYSLIAGIFVAPFFVLGLFWVHNTATKFLNKYVFHSLYDYQLAISKLTQELNRYTDLNGIVDLIVDTIKKTMDLERAGVLLINSDILPVKFQIAKVVGFNEHNGISLVSDNLLTKHLERTQKPLVGDELSMISRDAKNKKDSQRFLELRDYMKHIEAALCLPLIINNKLIGMVVLGGKNSTEPYTQQDLELLSIMSFQAAIAIDKARLYKKVNDFNKTLQQKVDEQTKDLKDKAAHLEKLLQMRTEFLDIASHQLKTPISVIRGTISMFEEGSMDKVPEAKRKEFFHNIAVKADKLNAIISDILRASEMDTDEFKLDDKTSSPEQIEDIVKSVDSQLHASANAKNVELIIETPKTKLPKVMTSGEFLEQAIYNLVDNGIKYTQKGFVKVILSQEGGNVIIKVQDSGIGIPTKEQKKIFDKFARGTNAVNMYTDGSGLGLFIVKKIIEAHKGGQISVQSEEGKGTTFIVSLPAVANRIKTKTVLKSRMKGK